MPPKAVFRVAGASIGPVLVRLEFEPLNCHIDASLGCGIDKQAITAAIVTDCPSGASYPEDGPTGLIDGFRGCYRQGTESHY